MNYPPPCLMSMSEWVRDLLSPPSCLLYTSLCFSIFWKTDLKISKSLSPFFFLLTMVSLLLRTNLLTFLTLIFFIVIMSFLNYLIVLGSSSNTQKLKFFILVDPRVSLTLLLSISPCSVDQYYDPKTLGGTWISSSIASLHFTNTSTIMPIKQSQ